MQTGSNPQKILIIVQQSIEIDQLFFWDIKHNIEVASFEVGKKYDIIWDKKGDPYIITDSKVMIVNQRCSMRVFETQQLSCNKKKKSSL